MGLNQSVVMSEFKDHRFRNFQQNFDFLRQVKDDRVGEMTLYKFKFGQPASLETNLVMTTHKNYEELNEEQFNIFCQELKERVKLSHPNLLKVFGYNVHSGQELVCGGGRSITIYSEWLEHDLEKELIQRANYQEYFNESEIWYLVDSLVSVCQYLEQNQIYHGDLRPINIFLTENGYAKICDHAMYNSSKNGYIKTFQGEEKCFLSPEWLKALKQRSLSPTCDIFKSDVFSLGLTFLFACTLVNPIYCYDFDECQFNFAKVQEMLSKIEKRYSQDITALILKMLQEDPTSRITFAEIPLWMASSSSGSSSQQQNNYDNNLNANANNRSFQQTQHQSPLQQQQQLQSQVQHLPQQAFQSQFQSNAAPLQTYQPNQSQTVFAKSQLQYQQQQLAQSQAQSSVKKEQPKKASQLKIESQMHVSPLPKITQSVFSDFNKTGSLEQKGPSKVITEQQQQQTVKSANKQAEQSPQQQQYGQPIQLLQQQQPSLVQTQNKQYEVPMINAQPMVQYPSNMILQYQPQIYQPQPATTTYQTVLVAQNQQELQKQRLSQSPPPQYQKLVKSPLKNAMDTADLYQVASSQLIRNSQTSQFQPLQMQQPFQQQYLQLPLQFQQQQQPVQIQLPQQIYQHGSQIGQQISGTEEKLNLNLIQNQTQNLPSSQTYNLKQHEAQIQQQKQIQSQLQNIDNKQHILQKQHVQQNQHTTSRRLGNIDEMVEEALKRSQETIKKNMQIPSMLVRSPARKQQASNNATFIEEDRILTNQSQSDIFASKN